MASTDNLWQYPPGHSAINKNCIHSPTQIWWQHWTFRSTVVSSETNCLRWCRKHMPIFTVLYNRLYYICFIKELVADTPYVRVTFLYCIFNLFQHRYLVVFLSCCYSDISRLVDNGLHTKLITVSIDVCGHLNSTKHKSKLCYSDASPERTNN